MLSLLPRLHLSFVTSNKFHYLLMTKYGTLECLIFTSETCKREYKANCKCLAASIRVRRCSRIVEILITKAIATATPIIVIWGRNNTDVVLCSTFREILEHFLFVTLKQQRTRAETLRCSRKSPVLTRSSAIQRCWPERISRGAKPNSPIMLRELMAARGITRGCWVEVF